MTTQASAARIGFIGLGAMGEPMAMQVAKGGHPVMLFDADRARTDRIARDSAGIAAGTPADIGPWADIVVTMLPDSKIVEKVLFGDDGLAASLRAGSLVIEMSSGVPDATRALAVRLGEAGLAMIDAPVSGGVTRARSGDLAIMVGGDPAMVERARPVLELMGSSLVHVGGIGSAHAMKALNNLVSAGGFLIGIEALLIGSRYGLSPEIMVDVLNASTGMNNSTQKKFKQFVLSRKFDAGFGLDLMVKDLGIALGVATATDTTTPFSSLCHELWSAAQKTLGRGLDHTEVARFSEMIAGTELK